MGEFFHLVKIMRGKDKGERRKVIYLITLGIECTPLGLGKINCPIWVSRQGTQMQFDHGKSMLVPVVGHLGPLRETQMGREISLYISAT